MVKTRLDSIYVHFLTEWVFSPCRFFKRNGEKWKKWAVHSFSRKLISRFFDKNDWKKLIKAVHFFHFFKKIELHFNSVEWKRRHFHRKFCNIYAHNAWMRILSWLSCERVGYFCVPVGWRSAVDCWVFASRGWSAKSRSPISGEHDCVCEMSFYALANGGVNRREWIQINLCARTAAAATANWNFSRTLQELRNLWPTEFSSTHYRSSPRY